jgi:hypothetical protein
LVGRLHERERELAAVELLLAQLSLIPAPAG